MLLLIIAVLVMVADQASKAYIRGLLPVGDSISLVSGVLHITHIRNPGAAFGLLPNQQTLFLVVSLAVIAFVLYYRWQTKATDRLSSITLGFILGGAVGNMIDRVASGRVTDFIDFQVWPVFNLADSAITVGVILLGFILLSGADENPVRLKN